MDDYKGDDQVFLNVSVLKVEIKISIVSTVKFRSIVQS